LYAVVGDKFISIDEDSVVTIIGNVGNDGLHTTMVYSFDRLAITSADKLFYYNGSALTQVTDADLGRALSVAWINGYFITTDGDYLVSTDITDPTSVSPLKYGSSEYDPDPIVGVIVHRTELYAINRYSIEAFQITPSTGFPLERIEGAQIPKGVVGPTAVCLYAESIAFVGGGRNSPTSVYIGSNGSAVKIATDEIENVLSAYTETELYKTVLKSRAQDGHEYLWISLPDRTLIYDVSSSVTMGSPIWCTLTSSTDGFSRYRLTDPVYIYNKWIVFDADTGDFGYMSKETMRQFGAIYRWEFATPIVYNEGRGAVFHSIELQCITGRSESGDTPYVSTSYSTDGITWSQDRVIAAGVSGERRKRLVWFRQGHMKNWRTQRFRGDSKAIIAPIRIEANMEPLAI
jgi:hypothetical protein